MSTNPLDDTYDEDCPFCGQVHGGECNDDDYEDDDRDPDEDECMDRNRSEGTEKRCLNPHYDHRAWECFTLEMCEAQAKDEEETK